jgi:hypothetical protein
MIYSVNGILSHMEPGIAVIECGGVGFKCFTSLNTQRALPQIGEQARLFTVLNVREDALDLYGFATRTELSCFKMLTGVSGVGPKVGLAILSELTPEQVAAAVATGGQQNINPRKRRWPEIGAAHLFGIKRPGERPRRNSTCGSSAAGGRSVCGFPCRGGGGGTVCFGLFAFGGGGSGCPI